MKIDPNKPLSTLTVAEFQAVQAAGMSKLIKWYLILSIGIPAMIFALVAAFGVIMVTMANRSA